MHKDKHRTNNNGDLVYIIKMRNTEINLHLTHEQQNIVHFATQKVILLTDHLAWIFGRCNDQNQIFSGAKSRCTEMRRFEVPISKEKEIPVHGKVKETQQILWVENPAKQSLDTLLSNSMSLLKADLVRVAVLPALLTEVLITAF